MSDTTAPTAERQATTKNEAADYTALRIWTVVGRKKRGAGGGHAKAEAWRVEVMAPTASEACRKAMAIHPDKRFAPEVIDSRVAGAR